MKMNKKALIITIVVVTAIVTASVAIATIIWAKTNPNYTGNPMVNELKEVF